MKLSNLNTNPINPYKIDIINGKHYKLHPYLKAGDEVTFLDSLPYNSHEEFPIQINSEEFQVTKHHILGARFSHDIQCNWVKYMLIFPIDGMFMRGKTFIVEKICETVEHWHEWDCIIQYPKFKLKSFEIPEYWVRTSDQYAIRAEESKMLQKLRDEERKREEIIRKNEEREERIAKHPWLKHFI